MGRRINKALGWAIRNTVSDCVDLDKLRDVIYGERENLSFERIVRYAHNHLEDINALVKRYEPNQYPVNEILLNLHFTYFTKPWIEEIYYQGLEIFSKEDFEHGESFIITPTGNEYYRNDDIIDYVETNNIKKLFDNTWEELDCGFYPYLSSLILKQNAKPFEESSEYSLSENDKTMIQNYRRIESGVIEAGVFNQLIGTWDDKIPALLSAEGIRYMRENYRPNIPPLMYILLHYFDCVTNWDVLVDNLRPTLVTFWR